MSEQDKLALGIEAAREGEIEVARDLLSQVVEEDENNVQAWQWLARITNDVDEKRIYLTTILQLDPGNEYATTALETLENKEAEKLNKDEFVPGISRRLFRLTLIGFVVFTFVSCSLSFLVASMITGNANARRADATGVAAQATGAIASQQAIETATRIVEATEEARASATALASITPPTNTPDPDLYTWTPTPTETVFAEEILDPPPVSIPGTIYVWGGRDVFSNNWLEMRLYDANDQDSYESITTNDLRVRYPSANLEGDRLVYMRFFQVQNTWAIESLPTDDFAAFPDSLNQIWGGANIFEGRNPSLSADGTLMVFVGLDVQTEFEEIYVADLAQRVFFQVTLDEANYDFPAISPDGTSIVAIQDEGDGPDLVRIDISDAETGFNVEKLTNDFGAFLETTPGWSPDASQIIYSVAPSTEPENHDIHAILTATNQSVPLIIEDGDEIAPFFSPDGNYIAYSSNPTADQTYNVYIFGIQESETWQLSTDPFDEFISGWSR